MRGTSGWRAGLGFGLVVLLAAMPATAAPVRRAMQLLTRDAALGGGPVAPVTRLAPLGVPTTADRSLAEPDGTAPELPPSFWVVAALPGFLGPEVRVNVEAVGPGGLVVQALSPSPDDDEPVPAFVDADGLVLRRQSDNRLEDAYSRYVSDEVVVIADPRAARAYSRTAREDDHCVRCDGAALGVSAEARELLSGDEIRIRLSAELRASLAAIYTSEQLDATALSVPAVRWEVAPSPRQEPTLAPSYGLGDAAPGTLLHSGEMTQAATDLVLKGRGLDFAFTRTYRSQTVGNGPLGPGWDFGYHQRLRELPNGDVEYYDGRGRRELFALTPGSQPPAYKAPKGHFVELAKTDAGWLWTDPQLNRMRFDTSGRLVAIADAVKVDASTGNQMRFFYDGASRLVAVEDSLGRQLSLSYDVAGRLETLTDPGGREVRYGYDAAGRLESVRSPRVLSGETPFPDGLTTQYAYAPATGSLTQRLATRDNLTAVTDPKGQAWLELSYQDADGDGRAEEVTQETWGGSSLSIAYDLGARQTVVTDRRGHARTYSFTEAGQAQRLEEPGGAVTERSYDDEGLLTREVLPLGRETSFTYATTGARRSRGNVLTLRQVADGRGGNGSGAELVTTLSYDPATNLPVSVVDPRGARTEIERDEAGLPMSITEAVGMPEARTTSWQYNAFGQPTRRLNPNGHATTYSYFASGASRGYLQGVLSDAGGLGLATRFETDPRGNVTTVIDPRGVHHETSYNELDWVVDATAAASASTDGAPALAYRSRYHYDRNGNLTEEMRPAGDLGEASTAIRTTYGLLDEVLAVEREVGGEAGMVEESFEYDANLNLIRRHGAEGQLTEIEYDPRNLAMLLRGGAGTPEQVVEALAYDLDGQLATRTDGRGKVWRSLYDGFGRPQESVDPLGNRTTREYDAGGNLVRRCVFDGTSGTMLSDSLASYDLLGRLAQSTEKLWQAGDATPPQDVVTRFVYDAVGNLTSMTDPLGRTTSYQYDGAERLRERLDAAGNRLRYQLDRAGNVLEARAFDRGADGTMTEVPETMAYDALGRETSRSDALGNTWTSSYDARSNLRFQVDPEQYLTEHRYDGLDRRVRSVRPEGMAIDYLYDRSSRLQGYRDALGQSTTWTYDALDRATRVEYPDATARSFGYDAAGNRIAETDANGTQIALGYDDANRLVTRQATPAEGVEGAVSESYGYDGLSRLSQALSGGESVHFDYDSLSRPTAESNGSRPVHYDYDVAGNRAGITYPSGKVLAQSFDPLNRLSAVAPGAPGLPFTKAGESLVAYSYRGPLEATKTLPNGIATNRGFDAARRLVEEVQAGPAAPPVHQESLSWSPRSLKVAESRGDLNGAGFLASYDGLGRLLDRAKLYGAPGLHPNNSVPQPAELAGLADAQGFAYTAAQGLVERRSQDDGVTTPTPLPPDPSGRNRPSAVGGKALSWDANGNLIAKGDLRLSYDFRNRLVKVARANGEVLATYAYDPFNRRTRRSVPGQPLEETAWSGWREIETYAGGTLAQRRTFGSGLDEIVQVETDLDGVAGLEEAYSPLYDSTGNLVAMTGPDAKVLERYAYSPFGEQRILVDATPPRIEQVRLVDGELWLEMFEEVVLSELEKAAQDGTLRLVETAGGDTVAVHVAQPVRAGLVAGRRLVIHPQAPITPGTALRLEIPSSAVLDTFQNELAEPFSLELSWPASAPAPGLVLLDTAAPAVLQIALRERIVEVLTSEPLDPGSTAGILLDGQPRTWSADETGYRLTLTEPLANGSHALVLGTSVHDLAGTGLAEAFSRGITVTDDITSYLPFRLPDPRESTSSTVGNRFGFHGRPTDPETGFVYLRNRYYDPELGSFITADPLGYVDGPSMYAFAGNDPVNQGDPLGLCDPEKSRLPCIPQGPISKQYHALASVVFDKETSTPTRIVAGVGAVLWAVPAGVEELARGIGNAPHNAVVNSREGGEHFANAVLADDNVTAQKELSKGVGSVAFAFGDLGMLATPFSSEVRGVLPKPPRTRTAPLEPESSQPLSVGPADAAVVPRAKTGGGIGVTRHGVNQKITRGVRTADELDAIRNPLDTRPIKVDELGRPSQRVVGQKAEVVRNPETGEIVSVNPTSTKKAERLLRRLEDQ